MVAVSVAGCGSTSASSTRPTIPTPTVPVLDTLPLFPSCETRVYGIQQKERISSLEGHPSIMMGNGSKERGIGNAHLYTTITEGETLEGLSISPLHFHTALLHPLPPPSPWPSPPLPTFEYSPLFPPPLLRLSQEEAHKVKMFRADWCRCV